MLAAVVVLGLILLLALGTPVGFSLLIAGTLGLWAKGGLDMALGVLRTYPDGGILQERTQRLRFALGRLNWTEPITPAERRVLELLPTHLTLEQIAEVPGFGGKAALELKTFLEARQEGTGVQSAAGVPPAGIIACK